MNSPASPQQPQLKVQRRRPYFMRYNVDDEIWEPRTPLGRERSGPVKQLFFGHKQTLPQKRQLDEEGWCWVAEKRANN